jgi:3-deoxy-D-manno-octulosonic-acid transferase
MIYLTYNTLLTLSLPLAVLYLLLSRQKRLRMRRGLGERMGFLGAKRPAPRDHLAWFHASSVGEVVMTAPLIHAVQERFPHHHVWLSTMTETGQETATRLLGDRGMIFFLPLDLPWTVGRVLGVVAPRALFIAETEIWPNLVGQCRRRGIPVVLFNGRISDRSFDTYRRFRFFFKEVLRGVCAFGMQSERDAERIVEIGASQERVIITGNLKFDRPTPQLAGEEKRRIRINLGLEEGRPVFVAGSTHRGEETIVLRVYRHLKQIEPSLVLIVAPRHLARLDEVVGILNQSGVSWIRKTQLPGERFAGEVILLDTMGDLEEVYSIGTVVFVGKSLVPGGGHNILEPAAFGKPVLFGPHMENFREIAQIMKLEGGGIEVRREDELLEAAQRLLQDGAYYRRASQAALRAIEKNQGAIRKTLEIFERYLNSSRD